MLSSPPEIYTHVLRLRKEISGKQCEESAHVSQRNVVQALFTHGHWARGRTKEDGGKRLAQTNPLLGGSALEMHPTL